MPRVIPFRSTFHIARALLRASAFFLQPRPRTPLRILCIAAVDALHRLHHAGPLSAHTCETLGALLDFGACANAALDGKPWSPREFCETRAQLAHAGLHAATVDYLHRLTDLEARRPVPGGDSLHFQKAVAYREAVVRLSLGMVWATASGNRSLDDAIRSLSEDPDLSTLFRIVMQCQIVDDALDYPRDLANRLPSFLTATRCPAEAFELTRRASRRYAANDSPGAPPRCPLAAALLVVTICARLVILHARCRHRLHRQAPLRPAAFTPSFPRLGDKNCPTRTFF